MPERIVFDGAGDAGTLRGADACAGEAVAACGGVIGVVIARSSSVDRLGLTRIEACRGPGALHVPQVIVSEIFTFAIKGRLTCRPVPLGFTTRGRLRKERLQSRSATRSKPWTGRPPVFARAVARRDGMASLRAPRSFPRASSWLAMHFPGQPAVLCLGASARAT